MLYLCKSIPKLELRTKTKKDMQKILNSECYYTFIYTMCAVLMHFKQLLVVFLFLFKIPHFFHPAKALICSGSKCLILISVSLSLIQGKICSNYRFQIIIFKINPNRKIKSPHFEDKLVIIKDPKGRVCVSVNSVNKKLKKKKKPDTQFYNYGQKISIKEGLKVKC